MISLMMRKIVLSLIVVICSIVLVESVAIDACTTPCKCYYRSGEYYVDCVDADLSEFPSGIPSKVQRLYLQGNSIVDVGITNHLGYFPDLEIIFLHNNPELVNVTADAFLNVPKLKMILLHYTNIDTLLEGTFRNNTELEYIWIFNSNLQTIEKNVFENLTSLRELKLNNNKLTPSSLPGGQLRHLNNLKKLRLEGNSDLPYMDCCQMCGVPGDAFLSMVVSPKNFTNLPCECSSAITCSDGNGGTFALNDCYPQNQAVCPQYFFSAAAKSMGGGRGGHTAGVLGMVVKYSAVLVATVGAVVLTQLAAV